MAYQVRYNLRNENDNGYTYPYVDWLESGRHRKTAFMYSTKLNYDKMYTVFVPGMNILYMNIEMEYWSMEAYFLVDLYHERKVVNFVACSCYADNHWEELSTCPSGRGSVAFFKRCMRSLTRDFTNDLVAPFMGSEWTINMRTSVRAEVPTQVQDMFQELNDECFGSFVWHAVIGNFDDTYEKEYMAATKISAAFRGWSVRMKYRFNPYTTLGRHLVLRLFHQAVAGESDI